ncbi:MAG: rod shape-determining protein, partial [Clostridia bacterium]|nr:rod shape-determining protein [Clostridia bacterium]
MATQISIDLGSYKTVISEGARIVLEQPSIVTVDVESFNPVYFGEKAKASLGRTPETLTCVRPIERGVIADYDLALAMLSEYMKKS